MDTLIYRSSAPQRALLAGLGIALGLLAACARPAAQQAEPPPPSVSVAEVISREITEWDELTGRLEAVNTVEIRPRVSGFVSSVTFDEGALVRRGQLLFQIDPRPFQAQVDRLSAELIRSRATVQRTASELKRAERLAGENAMSLEERERRASAAEEANAQVAAVEAALRASQLDLEFTRVTSPIDGRVGRAIVTEGNLVSTGPGEATLLTTVVSLDPIYASFDADEQMFLRYGDLAREGKRASARQAGVPIHMALANDEDFPRVGAMNFLDNQVDPSTGTIHGRAVFRNADRSLTPGLFVRLRLIGTGSYRGVLIQDRAVGTDLDKRFVFVVDGSQKVQYRAVTLGPIVDGLRVVRSGLNAGDVVVVNGLQRVRPGVTIAPERVAMDLKPGADSAGAAPVAASAQ
ncbi:MAG TPA: efflux RND transporter periplasmic adaptor subunit [Polyangiaceae bacterium]|nr:efflux RND transporter periplasmic adaptor subunit [Polyangiaceae bacterium]